MGVPLTGDGMERCGEPGCEPKMRRAEGREAVARESEEGAARGRSGADEVAGGAEGGREKGTRGARATICFDKQNACQRALPCWIPGSKSTSHSQISKMI